VDDLLKNAFKATRTCESRAVQLQFYKLGKHLVIEVADNGIPFEVRSLVNMGIEKLTTYEDGSGIGLMDIWSTKEKYRATYHLDEYASTAPFSKKISLTFDKKNRYTIRTYRKNEILQMSRRADLQVYDDNE
jgi:sensor histidine kinase regulating citrate/malate metabolism